VADHNRGRQGDLAMGNLGRKQLGSGELQLAWGEGKVSSGKCGFDERSEAGEVGVHIDSKSGRGGGFERVRNMGGGILVCVQARWERQLHGVVGELTGGGPCAVRERGEQARASGVAPIRGTHYAERERRAGTGEWGGADSRTHCAERERGEWARTSGVAPTGGTHSAEREGRAGTRRVGRSGRKAEGDGFLSFFPFFFYF
jgi:hypothetical protein